MEIIIFTQCALPERKRSYNLTSCVWVCIHTYVQIVYMSLQGKTTPKIKKKENWLTKTGKSFLETGNHTMYCRGLRGAVP